jgi:alpha-beta hydrolase superfamily lysophospholipase
VTGASVDPIELRDGVGRKQAFHFGASGRPLFGFYHPPAEDTWRATGVVLCPPIGTDYTRSDRTYRHLAERLAASGFACLRFDLSGTGDSGGEEAEAELVRRWREDVGVAIEELRARSGAQGIALVGLRLGATLAFLHAAERGDVDSLVLWSPCTTGASFVAEVTKLHKLYTRIEPHLAEAPKPFADGEEALGLFLPRALLDELAAVDLLRTSGRPARRALVLDGGNVASRDALLAHLRDLGASPELQTHPGHKFLITVSHRSVLPDEPIDSIVRWLSDAHPTRPGHHPPSHRASAPGPCGERPIVVGEGHPLFGILTPADPARARPGRPAIVLSNAGCVNRSGPHRTYVRMARRWAQMGFDVLRLDLAGIGDSPAAPGEKENLTYPASALDDLGRAIHALGTDRAVIAGLCSGGDYAFQLGARDPRVAAAWMLNPRTFCVLELAAVESGAPPATSVDDVPRTLRAMAARGVDTVLVVSRNDPGVAYVDAHAGGEMRALEGVAAYHRFDLAGADHSFTPVMLQERVSDILTERLTALAPRPGGAAR